MSYSPNFELSVQFLKIFILSIFCSFMNQQTHLLKWSLKKTKTHFCLYRFIDKTRRIERLVVIASKVFKNMLLQVFLPNKRWRSFNFVEIPAAVLQRSSKDLRSFKGSIQRSIFLFIFGSFSDARDSLSFEYCRPKIAKIFL